MSGGNVYFPTASIPDRGRLLTASYSSTTRIYGDGFLHSSAKSRGSSISCFASTAGSLELYRNDFHGGVELLFTQPVLANDLTIVNVNFAVPAMNVAFVPSSSPGSVWIEGEAYAFA